MEEEKKEAEPYLASLILRRRNLHNLACSSFSTYHLCSWVKYMQVASTLRSRLRKISSLNPRNMSFNRPYVYIQDSEFAKLWKQRQSNPNSIAVVDVRDDDFEGGNVPGCLNIPSSEFPDKVKDLVTSPLKDGESLSVWLKLYADGAFNSQQSATSSLSLLTITSEVSFEDIRADLKTVADYCDVLEDQKQLGYTKKRGKLRLLLENFKSQKDKTRLSQCYEMGLLASERSTK
jgi:hypothetical protein